MVFFTTPEVQVSEDAGSSQVCISSDTDSDIPYDVTLTQMPSGINPATRKPVAIITCSMLAGIVNKLKVIHYNKTRM